MTNCENYRVASPQEVASATFSFHSQLLHIFTSTCTNCGQSHTASNLYDIYIARSGNGGNPIRNARPAANFRPGAALGTTTLKPRSQPICHLCVGTVNAPDPSHVTVFADEDAWRDTLRRKAADSAESAARKPRIPTQPSLSDL